MKKSTFLVPATILFLLATGVFAADWPGWRGADRTDISKETGLLKTWPQGGPKLLWTFDQAGIGYAGPAVVGDVLYTMGADEKNEYLYALDLKTRKKAWHTEIGPMLTNGYGDGPRGTPTVDGDLIYCESGVGNIVCVAKASGKTLWTVSLTKDLGGVVPRWGYTESPLVDGDRVIVSPGGDKGGVAALSKKDGKLEWQCTDLHDPAAYSSPIVAEVSGVRQYIQVTMKGIAGVSAEDGKLLWYHPKKEFATAVIPTPIYKDGYVYFTAGYGAGCELLKLTPDGGKFKVEKVYANKNMVNHHGGVILIGDYLYGFSDGKNWVCQNFKTGDIVWSDKSLEKGSLTCADGHLYCYGQKNGECVLIDASPKGWHERGRLKIPRQTMIRSSKGGIWTHPVVAQGKLFLRDQDLIFCYDVKEAK